MKAAWAWVIGALMVIGPAGAQEFPCPLNQIGVPLQSSGNNVASYVFDAPRRALLSLTVHNTGAAGFVMVFDATAVPANGAVSPLWCVPIGATSTVEKQWSSPVQMTNGITVALSTDANCATLAASAAGRFMGQSL